MNAQIIYILFHFTRDYTFPHKGDRTLILTFFIISLMKWRAYYIEYKDAWILTLVLKPRTHVNFEKLFNLVFLSVLQNNSHSYSELFEK